MQANDAYAGLLKQNNIAISMDGKCCWRENKRSNAKSGLGKYLAKYNQHRPQSALDDKTPDEFNFDNLPALPRAA